MQNNVKAVVAIMTTLLLVVGLFLGCSSTKVSSVDESMTLKVGYVSSKFPSVYMPWLSNQGISPMISSMIYQTLFSYDSDTDTYLPSLGKHWEYVVEPTAVPEDQDYLEVKIELVENAKWSDGTPFTAEDVYFTFDLATDYGRTGHAGCLAWTGDLLHKYEKDDSGKYNLVRQGIFTKDHPGNYTFSEDESNVVYFHVRKVLGAVTPLFQTILVIPKKEYKILSPKNQLNTVDPPNSLKKLFVNPIGTGAFTLDKDRTNSSVIVMNTRDDYHLTKEDGSKLYNVESIKFINYLEETVAINALKKGDIDVIYGTISPTYADNLSKEKELAIDYSTGQFMSTLCLNLNVPEEHSTPQRELLKDPVLRQAISLAIDQDFLIERVLGGNGTKASGGLFPATASFTNTEIPYKHDMELANKMLDEAGYTVSSDGKFREKDGVKLSYTILGNPGTRNTINYLKVLLEQIGIEVNFAEGGSNAVREYYYSGNFDMTIQGISFSMTNVDLMAVAHFVRAGNSSNYGQMVDENFAEMVEKMRTTLDYDEKVALIKKMQEDIHGFYYKIPLYCNDLISVYRTDRFTGFTSEPGSTIYNDETLQNLEKLSD